MSSQVLEPLINPSLTKPLRLLEQHFIEHHEAIKDWFKQQWRLTPPPVYGSVDLRNAGFKVAPIDMNLFPAGFNNLNPNLFSQAVDAAKEYFKNRFPNAKNILVIPEDHTRNTRYWESVAVLKKILNAADLQVGLGMLGEEFSTPRDIELPAGEKLRVSPLLREDDHLSIANFTPDMVLLNNDLSSGIPDILQNLQQPLFPPAELGWSQRLKSEHFQYYSQVVDEFADIAKIDPWLIAPQFRHCGKVDFMQQEGIDCTIANAEQLFTDISRKYKEYDIPYQPFVIVKADAGTYGMAVMTVRNLDELRNMNRKQRTRMATTKDGQPVRRVIIQEGVYTFETVGAEQSVAEPVVYMFGDSVIGGFYRVHTSRGVDENLNAPGMRFEPLAFPSSCNEPCDKNADEIKNRCFVYGIIGQLSMLAAAREMAG